MRSNNGLECSALMGLLGWHFIGNANRKGDKNAKLNLNHWYPALRETVKWMKFYLNQTTHYHKFSITPYTTASLTLF
ncbi:hypothetical protein GDO86_003136 [Hymenochirus boettgeri]|uniref:Uncharacterized protein n=1 Tax=Hymenochirus boettgeri TaxID=247094 RepID=A0A8T2K4M4_9PIPI|nr:hypothetical protein GDO86_003136 [Hymenochirus boettgeri]